MDEELLRPARELIAVLDGKIKTAEAEMMQDIERRSGDREYAKWRHREFYLSVEPMRRERDYIIKVAADYHGLQAPPAAIVASPAHTDNARHHPPHIAAPSPCTA